MARVYFIHNLLALKKQITVHTCIGRNGHLAHNLATVEREVVRELTLVCLVLMYKLKLVEVSVVILIG